MRTLLALLLTAVPAAAQSSYNYCQATPNSTGQTVNVGYSGGLDLTTDSFTLIASGCPAKPNIFGMFTYGQVQYDVPFGNGYLCISPFNPGITRMGTQPLLAQVVTRDMASHSAEFAAFAPGSSWNYQFWYRDPDAGGAMFNLSDGLHVTFAP